MNSLTLGEVYIAEMEKRFKELASGKVRGLQLDDLAIKVRIAYNDKKRKKS